VGESDSVLAGIPAARIAARAQQGVPVNQLFLKRAIRSVSLGNGIYPTATLAARLGIPLAQLSDVFWKAAAVPPDTIRARGEALRAALSAAKQVTLTSANGTNITFAVAAAKGSVSDGALTPEKVKMGGAASQTWVPAGEFLVPVVAGSAEGKVVVDTSIVQGTVVTGLTLTYHKGVLASMTAASGLDPLKAEYDAAKSGKDAFSFIDVGLNPAVQLPTNSGRIVWMAAGGVTVGMGDNTGWGGSNVSDFTYVGAVRAPTLTADGKALIDNGKPK
ncbi:MAG TPA: hypothetical protein VMH39_09565, partial [Gemmatimonadaceae bacterium]|nr:hypothetical protein [Gemmatimonadaceae bacterium]